MGNTGTQDVASVSTHSLQATVDFGRDNPVENNIARVAIPAPWVVAQSIINCTPAAVGTADHDAEDVVVESLSAYPANIIPGISFDVEARAPNGSWGIYIINVRERQP